MSKRTGVGLDLHARSVIASPWSVGRKDCSAIRRRQTVQEVTPRLGVVPIPPHT